MSTVPPEPPSVSPVTVAPLPWEARDTRGFLPALFDTLGLFLSRPSEAWARTRESGDIGSPLLFAVLISWGASIIQWLIGRVITVPALPGYFGRRFGAMGGYGDPRFVVGLILAPIFVVIGLFIVAAVLHVCCLIVGALTGSRAGFEGTFRVVAYSDAAHIASIVPVIGPPVAAIWGIVLAIMGITRLHRTTQGKAIAAVLIPVILCCGGLLLLGLIAGAALFSRFGR
jgi:hypothetical protein